MSAKHECCNCGRTVSGRSAIETIDYDFWGDPTPVWLCRDCYGADAATVGPAQPTLGFPDESPAEDAA